MCLPRRGLRRAASCERRTREQDHNGDRSPPQPHRMGRRRIDHRDVLIQQSAFLPPVGDDLDAGVKAVSVVFAVVAAIGAWGLWRRRTWGGG